ncbi:MULTISPECIES: DUF4998 domain-containing protein [Niastella]|uniref:DUF4998 domain-containing protein n=1 Tax=Niastella soli TaxID=2821487 RepID=A0ABS3YLU8_9BACT|nr:DUF4998 domain-containing protein [Niastella soli]MBO9198871.1 DUF4998 domain-containing protein [Niastella soli]
MRVRKYSIYGGLLVICCAVLFACSKMNATYDEFTKDGEVVYIARVDSVITYPGNNRIDLSMLLISDPRISKVKVYWTAGGQTDSVEKAVQRTDNIDTVRFSFKKLAEASYTFNIYSYDKAGHRSVKNDVIGEVYGERYISQLVNRAIKSGTYIDATQSANIKWFGVAGDVIGQEIIYTDNLGTQRKFFAKNDAAVDSTLLPLYKKGSAFQFRTLYKPVLNAIDTFYSNYENRQVP